MDTRLLRNIEKKTNEIKIEISRESQNRTEAHESLRNYLEVDIPKLQEALKSEAIEREASES